MLLGIAVRQAILQLFIIKRISGPKEIISILFRRPSRFIRRHVRQLIAIKNIRVRENIRLLVRRSSLEVGEPVRKVDFAAYILFAWAKWESIPNQFAVNTFPQARSLSLGVAFSGLARSHARHSRQATPANTGRNTHTYTHTHTHTYTHTRTRTRTHMYTYVDSTRRFSVEPKG